MPNVKQYDYTNTGIIGKNDYKQKDKQPDQRGRVNIKGLWFWVSGWDRMANGRQYTSLAFTEMTQAEVDNMMEKRAAKSAPQQPPQQQQPQQQPQQQAQAPAQQTPPAGHPSQEPPMDFDKDIPF